MSDSNITRKAQTGEPTTNGGQFGTTTKPEATVSLAPARTQFGGYELRGLKIAGQGMEGRIWTATVYRDGKAVVHITEQGDGGSLRLVEKSTGHAHTGPEIDAFRSKAAEFYPEYATVEPEGPLAEALMFSAELDKLARRTGRTRAELVNAHIAFGEIQESEHLLFTDPDAYLESLKH